MGAGIAALAHCTGAAGGGAPLARLGVAGGAAIATAANSLGNPAAQPLERPVSLPRSLAVSWLASIGAQTAGYGIILWGPTLFVLQLGVTPAYAADLFIDITAAGILGRISFSVLSEVIGRRSAGMLCGFGGAACVAAAGILHDAMLGSVSLFWLFIVLGDFFYDGGFAVIGPYMAEVWPTNLRATGMGSAYGFGGIGKIVGPLGLALIVDSANVVKPDVTVAAIPSTFLFLAAWLVLCGLAFLLFGFETRNRSLAALDED